MHAGNAGGDGGEKKQAAAALNLAKATARAVHRGLFGSDAALRECLLARGSACCRRAASRAAQGAGRARREGRGGDQEAEDQGPGHPDPHRAHRPGRGALDAGSGRSGRGGAVNASPGRPGRGAVDAGPAGPDEEEHSMPAPAARAEAIPATPTPTEPAIPAEEHSVPAGRGGGLPGGGAVDAGPGLVLELRPRGVRQDLILPHWHHAWCQVPALRPWAGTATPDSNPLPAHDAQ